MSNNETKKVYKPVKTRTVFQMEGTECGAAALCMILAYYGRYIPLEQLRIECGIGRDGSSIKNIKKAAARNGLKAATYYFMPDNMETLKTPAILYWNYGHYVVFEGVKNGFYYINDPAKGRRRLSFDEFNAAYSKIAVEFDKTDEFVQIKEEKHLRKELVKRISTNKSEFISLFLLGLILVFPSISIPMLTQAFVDKTINGKDIPIGEFIITLMSAMLLFQLIFSFIRMKVQIAVQTKMKLVSSYEFLNHMFKLPIQFFEQRLPGSLAQRVENNINLSTFAAGELLTTALDIFIALFFLIIMLMYSPALTLIGVGGVIFNILLGRYLSKRLDNIITGAKTEEQKLLGNMLVALNSIETIKASGTEDIYLSKILGSYAKSSNAMQVVNRTAEILSSVPQVISKVFETLILIIGGSFVIRGQLTNGILVAFAQILIAFIAPMNTLVGFFSKIKIAESDVTCVNDVMKYEMSPKYDTSVVKDSIHRLEGYIEFKNISFGYTPLEAPFIENLCLKAKPGQTIALVGASGSGKSTIGKLASGLLLPWSGEILFDGYPINRIPASTLSYYVCSATQKISMVTGTIKENITMWNDAIDEKRIVQAAKDACIHDTIVRLPNAYDDMLNEAGTNFSGGEKQRIEIARALVTNPSVLILDEATSALDPIVEEQIMNNIKRRGCTCIVIAHRLSTIRDCDEIIVLDKGKIVQRGTHEEMKIVEGPYKELIEVE